ncbi:hypothetical protein MBLNU13_g00005t1 [Cladosporium sp. NU13]
MRVRDWRTIEAIFRDVKHLFAAHNKWGDYGIALPFKDFDLHYGERLIDFGGSSMPWYGVMTEVLERRLVPKSIKIWEGKIEAMSYKMQCENTSKAYDLAFEKAVLGRLGRLSLVRLDCPKEPQYVEVEGVQNGVVVTYPAAVSEELLSTEDLIPIMWEFRRLPYGASDTYEIMATRFRRAAGIDTNYPDSSQTWEALDTYAELGAWLCESANGDHESTPTSELYEGQDIQRRPVNAVLIEDSVLDDRPAGISDGPDNLA